MAGGKERNYRLDKSENFDEYMKTVGVGLAIRKMGSTITPAIELAQDGDEYTLTTSSTFKITVIKFKAGEDFDEETVNGRKVMSVCTFENPNKLVHEQEVSSAF